MAGLYKLNPGDLEIFDKAKTDPNYFTDYYLKSKSSGTYWRKVVEHSDIPEIDAIIRRWQRGYEILLDEWYKIQRPDYFEFPNSRGEIHTYKVIYEEGIPVFFENHGVIILPWWHDYWEIPQKTRVIIGGYGCLSFDSRIYDIELNQHISIGELVKQKRAPVVLSWTGTRFVKIKADLPFKKGTKELYKVTLISGKSIECTLDHVFLTNQGWKRLDEVLSYGWSELQLLGSSDDLLPSSWESDPQAFLQDARHYWNKVGDSQSYYQKDYYSYDEQLLQARGSARYVVPSLDDALEYSHYNLNKDVLEEEDRYNRLAQSYHPSKNYSSHQIEHLLDWQLSNQSSSNIFEEIQGLQIQNLSEQEFPCTSSLPQFLFGSVQQRNQSERASYGDQFYQTSYSPNRDTYTPIVYEKIESVKSIGEGDYYDLHIPIWNNYLAEGIIHHNSSKTWMEMNRNLKKMATTPFYRCFVIAPFGIQATEVLTQAKRLINGTEYQARFMQDGGFRSKPNPSITVKNSLCIESTMEFYSIEKNADKLLNMSGDAFHVEQAEQVDDLDWLQEIIGSRLRGQAAGRELEGIITYIANSTENGNPQLWDYYDEALTDPKSVKASSPQIYDNPYITPSQLIEITKRIQRGSNDPNIIARALKGARPIGSGEHFSRESIEKCRENDLDDKMAEAIAKPNTLAIRVVQPKAQVVEWSLPPVDGRDYLLCADPGWANPPARNSAAMFVLDITNYPLEPATVQAFSWVYGHNSPEPWIMKYIDLCTVYHCKDRNGFDSTGAQAGYGRMVHGLQGLTPWEVNLAGGRKYIYLNALKSIIAKGKIQFPDIPMAFSQLAKYKLPDEKLRQDIVAALIIVAAWLDFLYPDDSPGDLASVYKKEDGRYKFHERVEAHRR